MKSICNKILFRKGGIKKKKKKIPFYWSLRVLYWILIRVEMMPMANHVISLLIEHQWLVKKMTLLQNKKKTCYILFHKKEGNLYWPEVIVKKDWHIGNGHFENLIDLNRVILYIQSLLFSSFVFYFLLSFCLSCFSYFYFYSFLSIFCFKVSILSVV